MSTDSGRVEVMTLDFNVDNTGVTTTYNLIDKNRSRESGYQHMQQRTENSYIFVARTVLDQVGDYVYLASN